MTSAASRSLRHARSSSAGRLDFPAASESSARNHPAPPPVPRNSRLNSEKSARIFPSRDHSDPETGDGRKPKPPAPKAEYFHPIPSPRVFHPLLSSAPALRDF